MISAHHHSAAFTLATKSAFFLSIAILSLLGLFWSVAYCTIGELGTRHLCEYFGARGFAPLIVVALIGLGWPLMVRIANLVAPVAASWAASGRGTGKIAGLTAHDSAADAAWALCGLLKWAGLAIAFAGVALFGWYFVLANARAARNDTDNTASVDWGGPPAMRGVKLLVLGVLVQLAGFVLALMLPARL